MGSATITVAIADSGEFESLLKQLDAQQRPKAVKTALRNAGQTVARRARQLAPRSIQTGTRDDWSAATAALRASAAELHRSIGVVIRDYGDTFVAIVGPQYPAGAVAHLIEFGHELVAWGRPTGQRVPPQPFLRPAADETVAEQRSAIEQALTEALT